MDMMGAFQAQQSGNNVTNREPFEYSASVIVAKSILSAFGWRNLTGTLSENFYEINQIDLWSGGTAQTFALALVPKNFAFNLAGGLNQEHVYLVKLTSSTESTHLTGLKIAVTKNDSFYAYADGGMNFRISGKVVGA